MRCVRDARLQDVAPPGDTPDRRGWVRAGWASWFGPADADLYRVDDARWLFATPERAARWFERLAGQGKELGASEPAVSDAGLTACAYGAANRERVHVIAGEIVVCRLRAVAGEAAVLASPSVLALAQVVADRLHFFLAGDPIDRLPAWWAQH
jgi:hypothetical protein